MSLKKIFVVKEANDYDRYGDPTVNELLIQLKRLAQAENRCFACLLQYMVDSAGQKHQPGTEEHQNSSEPTQ
jgi:hypothetical protein